MENIQEQTISYARLITRVKASLIDTIFLVIWVLIVPSIVKSNSPDATTFRVFLILIPILFYEPVMITIFGCTIGQRIFRIRVYRENTYKKCPLHLSFIRWLLKSFLGFYSLMYMFFTDKMQAVHDKAAGTVVITDPKYISNNPQDIERGESGQLPEEGFVYPSSFRRFVFFFVWFIPMYYILAFTAGVILIILYGENLDYENLPDTGNLIILLTAVLSIGLFVLTMTFAYKGLLPGARRKRIPAEENIVIDSTDITI